MDYHQVFRGFTFVIFVKTLNIRRFSARKLNRIDVAGYITHLDVRNFNTTILLGQDTSNSSAKNID